MVKTEEKYQFVYIKATEGQDFTDKRFAYNWKEAKKQGFLTGAYHFFSMKSTGKAQAEHFMRVVPCETNSLPPVIDLEVDPNLLRQRVQSNLTTMLQALEHKYKQQPILYATYDTYNAYIKGHFDSYRIWIRDIYRPPTFDSWTIWQYHNRGHVAGINTFVDINVLQHSEKDLIQPYPQ
jgi:lysozyme